MTKSLFKNYIDTHMSNLLPSGNNIVLGNDNAQPSALACAESCREHADCDFWTFGKGDGDTGPCYLKDCRTFWFISA